MEDRDLITISRGGVFSLEQARAVLPVIRRITQEFSVKVETLMARLESVNLTQTETITRLENEVNELIKAWHEKIKKLGAKPKGLWLVDFDSGDGYFCWKYPEIDLEYWHSYQDGFTGRVSVVTKQPTMPGPEL
ncbi:MAG: DUF2203 domain-containing protein [Bdellovibrionales bacterium]